MASLDDFFAKKDKSKKKKAKSDVLTQQESAGTTPFQTQEKKKKEKPAKSDKSDSQQNPASESKEEVFVDAEWADYVPEQEADYSGLRIQTLKVKEEVAEDSRESGSEEENEDGERKERKEGKEASGPWQKKKHQPQQPSPVPEPVKVEPVAAPPAEPAKTGKYIPPSMRHGNQRESGSSGISSSSVNNPLHRRGRGKHAPNLQSEEDFPTLGIGEPVSDGGHFEKVKSGGRQSDQSSSSDKGGLKLTLGNKFDALQSGAD